MNVLDPYFIKIDETLIPYLGDMLTELCECKLEVCLIPSQNDSTREDGGMIRVCIGKNPEWYSNLCSSYIRKSKKIKKQRTIIKRKNVIELLEHMIRNGYSKSKYCDYLVKIATDKKQVEDQYTLNQFEPWNDQF